MIEGILWAIAAGVMLGSYAIPEKYMKGLAYENKWFLFFFIALIAFPLASGFGLIRNFSEVLAALPSDVIMSMVVASFIWGVGVQLWSKAINYIGVALGFSIFIGSVILVGTLLPFFVDGVPATESLTYILAGLAVILLGIAFNGRAGMIRQVDEHEAGASHPHKKSDTMKGVTIAIIGGLCATGFSFANAVGVAPITEAVVAQGNPVWMSAIAIMVIIYLAGALYVIPYFVYHQTKNKSWGNLMNAHLMTNLSCGFVMAFFNYVASAAFAYAAFTLGTIGNSVGYAIYNTVSVLLAVLGGVVTHEWKHASVKAHRYLYMALAGMITGVVLIAYANAV